MAMIQKKPGSGFGICFKLVTSKVQMLQAGILRCLYLTKMQLIFVCNQPNESKCSLFQKKIDIALNRQINQLSLPLHLQHAQISLPPTGISPLLPLKYKYISLIISTFMMCIINL